MGLRFFINVSITALLQVTFWTDFLEILNKSSKLMVKIVRWQKKFENVLILFIWSPFKFQSSLIPPFHQTEDLLCSTVHIFPNEKKPYH